MLGNGGVAWFKPFNSPNATYGVHTDKVTFWNKDRHECLRVIAMSNPGSFVAMKFSRLPDHALIAGFSVTHNELSPKYDPGLNRRRFLPDRQDVWKSFAVVPSDIRVEYDLSGQVRFAYTDGYRCPKAFELREA